MTDLQKNYTLSLHSSGLGYTTIAKKLGISPSTIKSFLKKNAGKTAEHPIVHEPNVCLSCGKPFETSGHGKNKQFCSPRCRTDFWNKYLIGRAKYKPVCKNCGKTFSTTKKTRKFCCHECYIKYRFGGRNEA